jgi:zona occludens toxin (predicted ATPase)
MSLYAVTENSLGTSAQCPDVAKLTVTDTAVNALARLYRTVIPNATAGQPFGRSSAGCWLIELWYMPAGEALHRELVPRIFPKPNAVAV